ncbi:MAG: hypothetical protein ACFFDI_32350 [Promethearchaeota archaeon]
MGFQSVWIWRAGGIILFSINLGTLDLDESLFSGFWTAISAFSKEVSNSPLDFVRMGPLSIFSSTTNEITFAVAVDREVKEREAWFKLGEIIKAFFEMYTDKISDPFAPRETFDDFNPILTAIIFKEFKEKGISGERLKEAFSYLELRDELEDALEVIEGALEGTGNKIEQNDSD